MRKRPHFYYYRKIYVDNNGKIPLGHEIHHVDGNPWNNHPTNLVALSVYDHYLVHKEQGDKSAAAMIKKRLNLKPDYREDFPTFGDSQLRYLNVDSLGRAYRDAKHPELVFEERMDQFEGSFEPENRTKITSILIDVVNKYLDLTRGGKKNHKGVEVFIIEKLFIDGWTTKELSNNLGIVPNTIRVIKKRALAKLKSPIVMNEIKTKMNNL